jgi:mRNA-degrading endonuclease toxin of MazEF toxin-antitoxin module
MSDSRPRADFRGGQIVVVDWRGDALPKEPNKPRPAVVIENQALFAPDYENVIVVPLPKMPISSFGPFRCRSCRQSKTDAASRAGLRRIS